MTYKSHAVVKFDSRNRNLPSSSTNTNYEFFMNTPINFFNRSKNKQYFVRIENVKIPMSFYNVRDGYDNFNWDEFDGIVLVPHLSLIPHGNYSIDELASEVSAVMNADTVNGTTYTMVYDEIKQIMTISGTGGATTTINIHPDEEPNERFMAMLGVQTLVNNIPIDDTPYSISGDCSAYTNNWRYLKIFIDSLNSNNVYNNIGVQRIGLEVPVLVARNDYIHFDNHNGYYIKMSNMSSISNFSIKLTDSYNVVLDLRCVDWSFDLVIYEYNKAGTDHHK